MKKIILLAFAAMSVAAMGNGRGTMVQGDSIQAKDSVEGFQFTTVDSVGTTPVKDQNRSSTCWAFSTIGFLESEVLRTKGKVIDLSEMFVVSKTMMDRANYCVRLYNEPRFAPGGSAYDVIYCMEHYGLVPQEAMPGIRYGWTKNDTLPVHNELDHVAGGYLNGLKGLKKLSPVWKEGLQAIYDTYLGKCPEEFEYEGKKYTPKSYAEGLGLRAEDYVSLTSYTHHPFYERFALEVPDNWRMDQMYNVPIDELMSVIDNALAKGYTLAWGADVSETGFTRKGIGVVPDEDNGADIPQSVPRSKKRLHHGPPLKFATDRKNLLLQFQKSLSCFVFIHILRIRKKCRAQRKLTFRRNIDLINPHSVGNMNQQETLFVHFLNKTEYADRINIFQREILHRDLFFRNDQNHLLILNRLFPGHFFI